MCNLTHDQLAELGAKWLSRHGYKYTFANMRAEFFKENPDVLGMRAGFYESFVIEVKVSRADFLADKKKPHRELGKGIGMNYAYLAPKGLIDVSEVPYGWWLLEVSDGNKPKISVVKGVKTIKSKLEFLHTDVDEMHHFKKFFKENHKADADRKQTLLAWLSVFFDRLHDSEIDLSGIGNASFVNNRTKYKDQEIERLKAALSHERRQYQALHKQYEAAIKERDSRPIPRLIKV